jgi:hypothetical protein
MSESFIYHGSRVRGAGAEIGPEDLSTNLIVQLGSVTRTIRLWRESAATRISGIMEDTTLGTVKKRLSMEGRHCIGGSDARMIMGQDEQTLIRLWREKRGEVGPKDPSGNLIVQLGATEDLNRAWYKHHSGRASPRNVLAHVSLIGAMEES